MDYIYDDPTISPSESPQWQSLSHETGDRCVENVEELQEVLACDDESLLALWSTVLGYCESLCTSPKKERYRLYPIPLDALRRLVEQEFTPPTLATISPTEPTSDTDKEIRSKEQHRQAAKEISNWVWNKVVQKSNVKDEKHASSLYTVLRGKLENKAVDCFGAALVTVIALRQQGYPSVLTLSEDHAYESHENETCEVAIPGNTKAQKQKRGQEISKTFRNRALTPATSWLYMNGFAVQCQSSGMILAAAIANMNCLIESKANYEKYSQALLVLKRELLWKLKDQGHLDRFPFALCELGWAEEHATSSRGDDCVSIEWESTKVEVTRMEALYHEAVKSSQTLYNDKQAYPYCYLGFFHKDGGQEEEYRLGLALQFFAQAARVASSYKYESGDTLQLTKIFTKVSEFIMNEILCHNNQPRAWKDSSNAIECGRWLVAFFDYLLLWEELSGTDSFLPICQPNSKTGIAKAFAQLSQPERQQALEMSTTLSQRFVGLRSCLQSNKVSINETHLTIMADTKRRRKRKSTS